MSPAVRTGRRLSPRFVVFSLAPVVLLTLSAEAAVRVKYFVSHGYDWSYILAPFGGRAGSSADPWFVPRARDVAVAEARQADPPRAEAPSPAAPAATPVAPVTPAAPAPRSAAVPRAAASISAPPTEPPSAAAAELQRSAPEPVAPTTPAIDASAPAAEPPPPPAAPSVARRDAAAAPPPPREATPPPPAAPPVESARRADVPTQTPQVETLPSTQMSINWATPCVNRTVYSSELRRQMPRTWNADCFRGDAVSRTKNPDEYRIFFVGGSTVEDQHSDEEMMTTQVKRLLPDRIQGKRVAVVNAGRAGFESERILLYWKAHVQEFWPDLVVYYEAWNEQPTDVKFTRVDRRLADARNWMHSTLYYRSMLYTYAIEKFAFLTTSNDRFWKIDLGRLRRCFVDLARDVRTPRDNMHPGMPFVFVTQVIRFPRMWKGVDTFDLSAVEALLDRLRRDRTYQYDVTEISALNQRLAVLYSLKLCRDEGIPVIDILEAVEAQGDSGRAAMFTDLGHKSIRGNRIVAELIAAGLRRTVIR